MTLYGYARVSVREPEDKNLDLQVERLVRAGCSLGNIRAEEASGARNDRGGLLELLDLVVEGDTLVVTHIDRLSRGLTHSGIPVLKVRPTWDTVAELESAVITDDTLNVPPVKCTACNDAEERRRREEGQIQGRVDSMLKRMNRRQQPDPAKPPFRPWTHDQFERPMFPRIRQQVYANAIILTQLGFVQAQRKPWLSLFRLPGAFSSPTSGQPRK